MRKKRKLPALPGPPAGFMFGVFTGGSNRPTIIPISQIEADMKRRYLFFDDIVSQSKRRESWGDDYWDAEILKLKRMRST